jgi:pilus assembly protein Flp/PilA
MQTIQMLLGKLLAYAWRESNNDDGQTMIEYGLIVALISIVAILALTSVGANVKDVFNSTGAKLHS